MRYNPEQTKGSGCCFDKIIVVHNAVFAMAIDVLDAVNVVRYRFIPDTRAMADRSVNTTNSNFNENDVGWQRPAFIGNSPSSKFLIGHSNANSAKTLSGRRLFFQLNCLQLRYGCWVVFARSNRHGIREIIYHVQANE